MQGVRSEGRLHEVNNMLWYRRLYRDCIKHAGSRACKLLLLADLRRVQAAIKAGASVAEQVANGWMLPVADVCEHGYAQGCRACDPDKP